MRVALRAGVGVVSRFATAPLRRYADGLAQRQLLCLVRGAPPPLAPNVVRQLLGDVGARKGAVAQAKTFAKDAAAAAAQEPPPLPRGDNDIAEGEEEGLGLRASLVGLAAACAAQTSASGLAYAVLPAVATGRGFEVDVSFAVPEMPGSGEGPCGSSVVRAALGGSDRAGPGLKKGARLAVRVVRVDLELQKVKVQFNGP